MRCENACVEFERKAQFESVVVSVRRRDVRRWERDDWGSVFRAVRKFGCPNTFSLEEERAV